MDRSFLTLQPPLGQQLGRGRGENLEIVRRDAGGVILFVYVCVAIRGLEYRWSVCLSSVHPSQAARRVTSSSHTQNTRLPVGGQLQHLQRHGADGGGPQVLDHAGGHLIFLLVDVMVFCIFFL